MWRHAGGITCLLRPGIVYVFQKQAKNGKHAYNLENLNKKANFKCMAFTNLLSISSSFFTSFSVRYYFPLI